MRNLAWGFGLLLSTLPLCAQPVDPDGAFARRARQVYEECRRQHLETPRDLARAERFARACFDLGEYAQTDPERESLALRGIEAANAALQIKPQSAPAHYYLAMNLGQLARSRKLTALRIVDQMEEAFLNSIQMDPSVDFAGAHRHLGVLYRDTPGWPLSLGSSKKARAHFLKALELFPDHPGNQLNYLESLVKWKDLPAARKDLDKTRQILEKARATLTGEAWAPYWSEWDVMWQGILQALGEAKQ